MAIQIIDALKLAHEKKARTSVMETRKMHAWVHYYPNPGGKDELHCHPGDQTLLCLEGECTMRFPDGGRAVLGPGPVSANKHITYETGDDLIAKGALGARRS